MTSIHLVLAALCAFFVGSDHICMYDGRYLRGVSVAAVQNVLLTACPASLQRGQHHLQHEPDTAYSLELVGDDTAAVFLIAGHLLVVGVGLLRQTRVAARGSNYC